jgi:hypothetical protein
MVTRVTRGQLCQSQNRAAYERIGVVRRGALAVVLASGAGLTAQCLFPSVDDLASKDASSDVVVEGGADAGGIVFVQGASSAPLPPAQVALPAAVGAGDALVVCVAFPIAFGSMQVSDTLGRSFTLVGSQDGLRHLSTYRQVVFASFDGPGGLDTMTLSTTSSTFPDGGTKSFEVYAFEYRGIAAVDGTLSTAGVGDGGGAADAYSPWDAGTVTTTAANELLFAFVEAAAGARFDMTFTWRSTFHDNSVADMPTGAPGAYGVTGIANDDWVVIAAGFEGP